MPLYIDACALAKRYLPEGRSSQAMKQVTGRPNRWGGLFVSNFVEPEVVSAFAKFVRERSFHEQKIQARAEHPRMVDLFQRELRGGHFDITCATETLVHGAAVLLRHHPEWNIGAADAVHLATALALRADEPNLVFITADRGLANAAKESQFLVFNPDWDSYDALERLVVSSSAS